MQLESEELQRGRSSGEPSIAAKKKRSIALRAARVLRLVGYMVFFAVVFVSSGALGLGIAVALNRWLGWPALLI